MISSYAPILQRHFDACRGGLSVLLVVIACFCQTSCAEEAPKSIFPLGDRYRLVFEGGIRLEKGTFGSSRAAYNAGPLTVSEGDDLVWIAGHAHHRSVGAFELPDPVSSFNMRDYPIARNKQPFVRVAPPKKMAGKPNRVIGMQLVEGRLFVNTAEYYDANTDNLNTTVVINDPMNLQSSGQFGYYTMQGRTHAAGWMSPIPQDLQEKLGGPYLAGYASNIPINSRHSHGPSLFIWDPSAMSLNPDAPTDIVTTPLINYSLGNPLHEDRKNESRENRLWTELSKAHLGFVPPGSNDYIVIGSSGGHYGGIGYKITQDNGKTCPGSCAAESRDYYNYFWRYDLKDTAAVQDGSMSPHEIKPRAYGELPVFSGKESQTSLITGAAFNPASGRLYLLVSGVDDTQSKFEAQPLLLVYSLVASSSVSVDVD